MARVLSQQEIDSIMNGRLKNQEAAAPQRHVQPWKVREAGQLAADQARAITSVHESFARNLTHSLGAYLRVKFNVALVSVEQFTFEEFLATIPEVTYVTSYRLTPSDALVVMQIDHSIIYPIVDVLLGGAGSPQTMVRDTSEIESQIIEAVEKVICQELQSVWTPLGLNVEPGAHQTAAQIQRFLPPGEKTLALSFEITMPEARGTMNLLLPASVSNSMIRKLAKDWGYRRPRGKSDSADRLREQLLECNFEIELGIPRIKIPIREVLGLKPGAVIRMRLPLNQSASLILGDRKVFAASPVRQGNHIAAHLGDVIRYKQKTVKTQ